MKVGRAISCSHVARTHDCVEGIGGGADARRVDQIGRLDVSSLDVRDGYAHACRNRDWQRDLVCLGALKPGGQAELRATEPYASRAGRAGRSRPDAVRGRQHLAVLDE